jgi:hypothetical protein
MHLRCIVDGTLVLAIRAEPQDLPRVGESCVLPLPEGLRLFRVGRLARTYGFARALAGMDRLDLESVDLWLEEEQTGVTL